MKVGIHDNLVLSNVGRNDKGTFFVSFRPVSLNPVDATQTFDEFSDEGIPVDMKTESDSNLLIFCPGVPGFKEKDGTELSDARKADFIKQDFETFRHQLGQILGAYTAIKNLSFAPYKNTGITKENWAQEFLDENQRKKIYDNYIDQFIPMITPFLNRDDMPVRLKLVRQSAAKHYATIPSRYITDNPFIEPMAIPKEASQLKFSKYEKDKGLDNGDPIAQNTADPIPDATEENNAIVFGQR